jgi:hypothetical protein
VVTTVNACVYCVAERSSCCESIALALVAVTYSISAERLGGVLLESESVCGQQ